MWSSTPRTFVGATTFVVVDLAHERCRRAVIEALSGVDGVTGVSADGPSGTVTVTVDRPVDRADLAAVVDVAGHTALP